MLMGGQEVIIGAVTDPAFGKLVASARRHPGRGAEGHHLPIGAATNEDALSMLDGIAAAEILRGVRGAKPVHRAALAGMIEKVSTLVADFPGNIGNGFESRVRHRPGRDGGRRAHRARLQSPPRHAIGRVRRPSSRR